MTEVSLCPNCGSRLPANAPAGLCPKCLLAAGLESASAAQADPSQTIRHSPLDAHTPQSRFVAPAIQELAGLFPQLEILELLGCGGMGAVYKARQLKLDRLVALKIMRPDAMHDPQFAERFTREAQALARLNNQNIVTLHEFGDVELTAADSNRQPLYYFIMEYVDGSTLRQVLAARSLQPAEALAIVPQICEALQFAHDEGVVHRDIKPENILLDKRGRVKIADFGLAKLADRAPEAFTITGTQQRIGTPRYMAPEQMEGSHAVDHRADIYSLGVVFYEMLTGEIPAGHFAPPSQKAAVDARLDDVVLRALAQEPDRRYQRVDDVKSDVEHISNTASPRATQAWPAPVAEPDASSGARVSPAAVTGAVLTAIGLVTGATSVHGVLEDPPPLDTPILLLILSTLVLALCAMVLGILSFYRIRASHGRVVGLELAVFSAAGLPLAAINAAAFGVIHALTQTNSASWRLPPLAVSLAVTAVLCAPLNYWIVRRGWRRLAGRPEPRNANSTDSREAVETIGEPPPAGFTLALASLCAAGWIAAGALRNWGLIGLWAGIAVLATVAFIVVRWKLHYLPGLKNRLAEEPRGWRTFALTIATFAFVLAMLAVEQAQVNLLDSYYFSRIGEATSAISVLQENGSLRDMGLPQELVDELNVRTSLHGRTSQRHLIEGLLYVSAAVVLLFAAVATYFRTRRGPNAPAHYFRPTCHVVALMWFTLPVVFAAYGTIESTRGWGITPPVLLHSRTSVHNLATQVDQWAEGHGYVRQFNAYGSGSGWDYGSYLLIPHASLDRWQASGRYLMRPKPPMCITFVQPRASETAEATVLLELPWTGVDSPEEKQWPAIVRSLETAIGASRVDVFR